MTDRTTLIEKACERIDAHCAELANLGEQSLAWFLRGAMDAETETQPQDIGDMPSDIVRAYLAGFSAYRAV
jgi:hypothetical protein